MLTATEWQGLIIAFLLGSIPTAYIVARAVAGVDIRLVGDGNVGARNVYFQVGHLPGVAVAILDILKGTLAIRIATSLGLSENLVLAAGWIAVLGHDFTPFLRFRGGQGTATSVGVLLALISQETMVVIIVSAILLLLLRKWDLSLALGFALFPVLSWSTGRPNKVILYIISLLPAIGIKKILDLPRRARIAARG